MTLDPPFRNISADIDETIAQLDALHAAGRARRADFLGQLKAVVAGLDAPGLPDEPEPTVERPQRDDERRRPARGSFEEPYIRLPERTTEGGPYGPQVRAKLRRIALGEERGW